MRLGPFTEGDATLIGKWLTPQIQNLIMADDLFDARKPYLVLLINDDADKPVGFFSVYNIDEQNRKCEVGTVIGEKSGHRITKKAVLELVKGLFARGMNRIYMKPLSSNTRAVKGAQYLGFQVEGVERESVFKNGKYEDLTIMSLLKTDYERKWLSCRQYPSFPQSPPSEAQ